MNLFLARLPMMAWLLCLIPSLGLAQDFPMEPIPEYQPADQALHDEILTQDLRFFEAYNTCDMETQASIYADKLEFFHDQMGMTTDREMILKSTKENICGKVTRQLVKESVEVYKIPNYGAIEIGFHAFHNAEEPEAPSVPSKFIAFWHQTEAGWKLARVVSLH
ncbi:nuclear transport factor 2 family protein [Pontibacter sp. G13]|uniref:nuclear transport factor 2 family protein n=1 Tax=Pontibacter sp. G13 TaxID=3074898 RepID=UPI00288A0F88|nr:nuclear transport factor 2 family protein [Pontibacter sp. G13]WNJ18366.1 nuclear transport factor 2 family protein [Pontibacter sp. G13]